MLALRRSVAARSLRAFSTTSASLKNKTGAEALEELAAQESEYDASTGAQASVNQSDDPAARTAKKIGQAAKDAAAEVSAQTGEYQAAEAGMPQTGKATETKK